MTNYSAASEQGYNDIRTDTAAFNALENGKWNYIMSSKPRSLAVFNQPTLPAAPSLGTGALGVAIEGRLEPAWLTSTGVVFKALPGLITLDAATDGTLTAPMVATNISGKLATWMPGSGGNYAAGAGGSATYTFNVDTTANYALWFEINCPTANDDSWYIKMDNGSATTWNNLSNGGVWSWAEFGTFNLSAGQHRLTVYEREDGAAMATIKLSSAATVMVEDRSQPAFELPEFNRYTRRPHFIDPFNTGTGSVNWQITPADFWVRVTQTSGSLASETRLWVSIDWADAPRSNNLFSSLTVSSVGHSLVIPVPAWKPPTPLPVTTGFAEDNHAVAIEAGRYSKLIPGTGATWSLLPHLGSGDGVMIVTPVTAASRTDVSEITNTSPVLEYNVFFVPSEPSP